MPTQDKDYAEYQEYLQYLDHAQGPAKAAQENPTQVATNIEQKMSASNPLNALMPGLKDRVPSSVLDLSNKVTESLDPSHIGQAFMGSVPTTPQGMVNLLKAGARGTGHAIQGASEMANAALHPADLGDKVVKGARGVAEWLKGVGKGTAPEMASEAVAVPSSASQGMSSIGDAAAKAANKAKNAGWDFPVRKNRIGMD